MPKHSIITLQDPFSEGNRIGLGFDYRKLPIMGQQTRKRKANKSIQDDNLY